MTDTRENAADRTTSALAGSTSDDGSNDPREAGIPDATIARLPLYLRALTALVDDGTSTVSSHDLASAAGVNPAKLRKDLSYLGSYGTRGVGYDVAYLQLQIAREIGLTHDWPVVVVGIGNLGQALVNHGGFSSRGFRIAAIVDADPDRVGERHGDLAIEPFDRLGDVVRELGISIGVIATPGTAAQAVADRLVAAGVSSILNFAPSVLSVPPRVEVRKVDLASELQILSYHEQRRALSDATSEASGS